VDVAHGAHQDLKAMTIYDIMLLVAAFTTTAVLAYVLLNRWLPTAIGQRMNALFVAAPSNSLAAQAITAPISKPVQRWMQPLANAAMNAESWLTSPLRIRFSNAGLNDPNVVVLYFASKTLLTFAMPLLVLGARALLPWQPELTVLLSVMLLSAFAGYYLPNGVVAHLVSKRQGELFRAFPDALDLLRVCVGAGLGLDAAFERVGREIQIESQALAQELTLLGLELRAGAARASALRHLALRVGLDDIDSLVSMLIQADRFGTSVAESLKMHSESLRAKRRLIAEEAAAKLPVKILMPLIFCVFPALLTVLLGPAVINVSQILLPQLAAP
jgi:tight adherence protein C